MIPVGKLVERLIIEHKTARYAFVLITFPFLAARDELERLRYYRPETGMDDLRRALAWARAGGVPGQNNDPRPDPSPVAPKWQTGAGSLAVDTVQPGDARPAVIGEWVSAACGCVWRESRPTGFTIDPANPRACTTHRADHPASVRPSPQGMAMVPVTYHESDPTVSKSVDHG